MVLVELNAIVECRTRRGDGTRERGKIVELNGREAVIEIENPKPKGPTRRRLPLSAGVGCGAGGAAHYRVVERADGTRVQYQPGGVVCLPKETDA